MPGSNIKTEIQISVPFLCGLILFLLVDRTGLGGQMVLAALSHEIGHLLAMTVLGEQPQKIVFGSFGIRIEKRPGTRLSYHKEILIMPRVLRSICWPQDCLLDIRRFAGFIFCWGFSIFSPSAFWMAGRFCAAFSKSEWRLAGRISGREPFPFWGAQDWRYWLR